MVNVIAGIAYTALGGVAIFLGHEPLVVIALVGIGAIYLVGNSIVSAIKAPRA